MTKIKTISVYCGSSLGKNKIYQEMAIRLGEAIYNRGLNLVYGGGNVGLNMKLSQPQGGNPVFSLASKFRRDAALDLAGGDKIGGIRWLLYSNSPFTMVMAIDECTQNFTSGGVYGAISRRVYPRIGIDPDPHGQEVRIFDVGANPESKCAQCVDFVFNPPIIQS